MHYIWGSGQSKNEISVEKAQETLAQETLASVKETLGSFGESFLDRSKDRLSQSFKIKTVSDALRPLLSSVSDYRKGLLLKRGVEGAEAQFQHIIKGHDNEAELIELGRLLMKQAEMEGEEGDIVTPHVDLDVCETQERLSQRLEVLKEYERHYELHEGIDKLREGIDKLRGLVMNSRFEDPELLESLNVYCDRLVVASAYVAQMNFTKKVILQSSDIVQCLLKESENMQKLLIQVEDPDSAEIIRNASSALVLDHLQPGLLVDMGHDLEDVQQLVEEHPELVSKIRENLHRLDFTGLREALRGCNDRKDLFDIPPPLGMAFGVNLRSLASEKDLRPLANMMFESFLGSLRKIEGLTAGVKSQSDGVAQLFSRTETDSSFSMTKSIETAYGSINVPMGLLKDFHRGNYWVNEKPFRAKTDLAKSENPEDFQPLVDFLEEFLKNKVSQKDLEVLLLYSFQSTFFDLITLSSPINLCVGIVLQETQPRVKKIDQKNYTFTIDENGKVGLKASIIQSRKTIEGIEFGWEGSVTFNFSDDYTSGSTDAEFTTIAKFGSPVSEEE